VTNVDMLLTKLKFEATVKANPCVRSEGWQYTKLENEGNCIMNNYLFRLDGETYRPGAVKTDCKQK
jgi:hypothetical protein